MEKVLEYSMEFVHIPPGTFTMGSPENEPGRYDDETPHKVTITKGFYMQTTEVTQGLWWEVMEENPSNFSDCGESCPVESVSWEDAQRFIAELNRKQNKWKYRLPTEVEWEYACRAGTDTPFSFGKCLSHDQANYDGSNPVPVASFPANTWGLYDMHGNVWEWCADWYGEYSDGPVTDPVGPEEGSHRVIRGGSWNEDAQYCRSAIRNRVRPDFCFRFIGFRLVRLGL